MVKFRCGRVLSSHVIVDVHGRVAHPEAATIASVRLEDVLAGID